MLQNIGLGQFTIAFLIAAIVGGLIAGFAWSAGERTFNHFFPEGGR